MEIQGEQILAVPRADVWRALNDPAVLKRCLPGCDTFEADGAHNYRVAMQAAVGPVRARFAGKLRLSDIVAPTSYALSFEGSGGVAGFGKGKAHVLLEDVASGTRLRYGADAQVGGRLAQVGARLIDGVTRRMADDFFKRFAQELNGKVGAMSGVVVDEAAVAKATPESGAVASPVQAPMHPPASAQHVPAPSHNHIAVIAAAVSATAAAVAVLAAAFVVLAAR